MYCWFAVYFLGYCWFMIHFDHLYSLYYVIPHLNCFLLGWIQCFEYVFQLTDGKALFMRVVFEDISSVNCRWSHTHGSDCKLVDGSHSLILWYSSLSFDLSNGLSWHSFHAAQSPRYHHICNWLASFEDCSNLNFIYLFYVETLPEIAENISIEL